jgi:CheY-like chemotaxis protein
MSKTIRQIRELLSQLETQVDRAEHAAEFQALSGLELPDIIADVVDLPMPDLTPYEAAFYMYLLRHSIIEKGTPYIRASRRRSQSGIVKSPYANRSSHPDNAAASFATVR